jgi:hypothetical protein
MQPATLAKDGALKENGPAKPAESSMASAAATTTAPAAAATHNVRYRASHKPFHSNQRLCFDYKLARLSHTIADQFSVAGRPVFTRRCACTSSRTDFRSTFQYQADIDWPML